MKLSKIAASLFLAALTLTASAGTITNYVGVDNNVGASGPWPNSNATSSAFQSALPGSALHTITFESTAPVEGDQPIALGNGVTLSFTNVSTKPTGPYNGITDVAQFGSFNTTPSGSNYLLYSSALTAYQQTQTSLATFTFATPIHSFGAYITGLNGQNNPLAPFQYSYVFNDGTAQSIDLNGPDSSSPSSVGFYGFTDTSAFSSVSLAVTLTNNDPGSANNKYYWLAVVGADDVTYTTTPEPASLILLGNGLLGVFGLRRRKH